MQKLIRKLLALLLVYPTAMAAALADEKASDALYRTGCAAAVEVLVNGHLNGSGSFVEKDGHIITAAHVIESPGQHIEVASPTVPRATAKVIAVDLGHDLALLKIDAPAGGCTVLPLADEAPQVGANLYCIGAPLFRHRMLLPGKVATGGLTFEYYADRYNEVTPLAATIAPGMSGGPWLDEAGHVIGVQSGIITQNAVSVGIAFASPLAAVKKIIKEKKTAATPTLGAAVEELWQQDRKTLDRFPQDAEGLIVRNVRSGGPADRGGLKTDDLIIAVGEHTVRLIDEVQRAVLERKPSEPLELTVTGPDGTGQRKLTVTLGKLEAAWEKVEK